MMTAASAINGPNDPVMMPQGGTQLDWEAELAVVFCKAGANIPVEDAMGHVAGFCVGNDVSERVFQLERGTQWTKGKSADTLKPLGPWLVTTDEVGDPNQLDISLNRERRSQAAKQYVGHDVQHRRAGLDHLALHQLAARGCDDDRHATRCGLRHEAAPVPQRG